MLPHTAACTSLFAGKCATGVIDLYRANATEGDKRGNLLWAAREGVFTNETGTLWGTSPNIFFPRRTETPEGPPLTSILVAFAPDVSECLA